MKPNPYRTALGGIAVVSLVLGLFVLLISIAAASSGSLASLGGVAIGMPIGGFLIGLGLSFGSLWLLVCALTYTAPSGAVQRAASEQAGSAAPSTHWLAADSKPAAPPRPTEPEDPPYL